MKVYAYSPHNSEEMYTFALSPIEVENHRATRPITWTVVKQLKMFWMKDRIRLVVDWL